MPQPAARDLYVNRPLTNISVAYQQDQRQFIADRVFPQVPVQRQGDLYYRYKREDWFRSIAEKRAPATETPGGGWEVDTASYFAHVWAVHKDIDDQIRANADTVFNIDRDAALWVTQNLLLRRDLEFTNTFLKTGVWSTDLTGVTGAPAAGQVQQWNEAGSDPIGDIAEHSLATLRTTGLRPNVLVIGPSVYNALTQHASILDRIKYTQRGIVTQDLLASLFGVDRVVVTEAIHNVADKGQTAQMNFMSDKSALLVYAPSNPGLLQPTGGYIFTWNGLLGGGAYGTRIRRFRMEEIASERVEAEMAFDMKVISPDLGVFINTVVA